MKHITLDGADGLTYARRSKHNLKNPGKSTHDQEADVVGWIEALGGVVPAANKFVDEGIGASRHSPVKLRAAYEKLIAAVESRPNVKILGLWALSRAAREQEVTARLLNTCERRGAMLVIGGRVYDPASWEDRLQLGITAVVDEAESSRIRDNVLRGTRLAAVDGQPHGRNVYGYRRVYNMTSGQLLAVEEDPEQGPVVREIVRRVLAGDTSEAIAKSLNARGVPRPFGGTWVNSMIRTLCLRPTYRGVRTHKVKDGTLTTSDAIWPPLISLEDADALDRIFRGRSRGEHSTAAKHPLTGSAECSSHGPMYKDTYTRWPVYRCYTTGCGRTRSAKGLEKYVRDVVAGWLADPDFERMRRIESQAVDTTAEEGELKALSQELTEAYDLGLSARGLASIEARILPRVAALTDHLDRVDAARTRPAVALPKEMPEPGSDDERFLLRGLVRVVIRPAARRGAGFDDESVDVLPR